MKTGTKKKKTGKQTGIGRKMPKKKGKKKKTKGKE
jgi:hypothetical protein